MIKQYENLRKTFFIRSMLYYYA